MRSGWLCVLTLLGGGVARALDVPTRMELRDVRYDVRSVDLPSGMRVIVEKDSTRPLVAVVSVVDVGGAEDPPGKEGLAQVSSTSPFDRSRIRSTRSATSWSSPGRQAGTPAPAGT
jgi:hypothetical protein